MAACAWYPKTPENGWDGGHINAGGAQSPCEVGRRSSPHRHGARGLHDRVRSVSPFIGYIVG